MKSSVVPVKIRNEYMNSTIQSNLQLYSDVMTGSFPLFGRCQSHLKPQVFDSPGNSSAIQLASALPLVSPTYPGPLLLQRPCRSSCASSEQHARSARCVMGKMGSIAGPQVAFWSDSPRNVDPGGRRSPKACSECSERFVSLFKWRCSPIQLDFSNPLWFAMLCLFTYRSKNAHGCSQFVRGVWQKSKPGANQTLKLVVTE